MLNFLGVILALVAQRVTAPPLTIARPVQFSLNGGNLESTTGAGASEPRFYGRANYLHAGGIDRPLSIWKEGVGSVRPHQNWRGQFARGTWGAGPLQGRSSDCAYGGATDCIPLH